MTSSRFIVPGVLLAVSGALGSTAARAAEGDLVPTVILACDHDGEAEFATRLSGIESAGPVPERLAAALRDETTCARAFNRLGRAGFGLVERLPVQGDFDGDSDVDGRDFLVWQRGASPLPSETPATVIVKCEYIVNGALKTRVAGREIGGAISTSLRAALASLESCAQTNALLAGAGFDLVSGAPAPSVSSVDAADYVIWQRNFGSGQ